MDNKLRNKYNLNFLHNILISDRNNNRIRILLLLILIISSWFLSEAIRIFPSNTHNLQEGISEKIIRFHVIANSNSDKDQYLKYQVKNDLVRSLQPYLRDAKDIEEAQNIIIEKLPFIQDLAGRVIEQNGHNYSVTASLSACYFPMKVYGDYTFPPGAYETLQVRIGNAQGRNWWCVMFPPLCFVDETYSIVDEDSEKKLEHFLTDEELDVLKNNKVPIKIRFKLFESIKKLFDRE